MMWPEVLKRDAVFSLSDLNGLQGKIVVVEESGTEFLFFHSNGHVYLLGEFSTFPRVASGVADG